MSEPFFHPLGDEITISDKDELVKIILEIDFEIGASKTSNFRERFTLGQYLLTLASLSPIGMSILYREARDAGLRVPNKTF